ncbi:copper transporter 6-like [Telopea speciosissima]|uniref:copper transporter 6-like n=1 Tax=Telopea speciosissima TaxID=54955 RepID=UPI001CC63ADB|nr:copper transporter 6-like [Telopea speciosissima]
MEMAGGAMMPGGMMPSPTMPASNGTAMQNMMMMHMTFFWGKNAQILFSGWPGSNTGMYVLALIVVFVLAVLVEWLSHCQLIKSTNHVVVRLLQTLMHTVRMGLAYLVMLALMSFNVGVFLVAIAGHALGFLLFGSMVFRADQMPMPINQKPSDLPPMKC